MSDWTERAEAVAQLDGSPLEDKAYDAFKNDWIAAYSAAFVQIATERGWTIEDAESWPPNIAQYAFVEAYTAKYDPVAMAALDVAACEEEAP